MNILLDLLLAANITLLLCCALLLVVATYYIWTNGTDPDIRCLFGKHDAGKYLGRIHIDKIDYATHAITYANILQCGRCGKTIKLDYNPRR